MWCVVYIVGVDYPYLIVPIRNMIINLWSERIVLIDSEGEYQVPFEQVEEHLTKMVIERYMHSRPETIYVIAGPGSFTNVRVGALVANLLVSVSHGTVRLASISKLDLFRYLYLQALLPASWYVYFGQRKNLWVVDYSTDTTSIVPKTFFTDTTDVRSDYFVDWFVGGDFEYLQPHAHEIGLSYVDTRVIVSYRSQRIDCTDVFLSVQKIEPVYGSEPNIG